MFKNKLVTENSFTSRGYEQFYKGHRKERKGQEIKQEMLLKNAFG